MDGLKWKNCYEKLKELDLPTTEYHRRRWAMIKMYKVCYGKFGCRATRSLFEQNDSEAGENNCKVKTVKANLEVRKH